MMKKHYFLLLAMSAILLAGCHSASMNLSVQGGTNPRAVEINRRIQNRNFTIDVRTAMPMGWRTIHLAPGYSLSIWHNQLNSRLPYFGRSFQRHPGRNRGLFFRGTVHDYQVTSGLRGESHIMFSVWSFNDRHSYRITVQPNGQATVFIDSNRRQPITFHGSIRF